MYNLASKIFPHKSIGFRLYFMVVLMIVFIIIIGSINYRGIKLILWIIKVIEIETKDMGTDSTVVERVIREIASASQQFAANAEEVAASSEEQLAATEEIINSAKRLEEMAENLNENVNKFKI